MINNIQLLVIKRLLNNRIPIQNFNTFNKPIYNIAKTQILFSNQYLKVSSKASKKEK